MSNESARKDALLRYKILAPCQGILGLGLLVCGIMGSVNSSDSDSYVGPPYFLGGYFVGCLQLLAAVFAGCVAFKGEEGGASDTKKREIGCCIYGHYIISFFSIMACTMGLIFAGLFGIAFSDDLTDDEAKTRKSLSYGLIAGCTLALCATIFSLYLVCTFGQLLGGVQLNQGRRGHVVVRFNQHVTPTGYTASGFASGTQDSSQMEQLRTQNLLLQQQLTLQQQMIQQQQQQQQQFSGAMYPPPPPPDYNTATAGQGFGFSPAMPSAPSVK